AVAAVAILLWGEDCSAKSGSVWRAFAGLGISMAGLIVLVLLVNAEVLGKGKTGQLLLPLLGALLALAVLPRNSLAVLRERDTWVMMLVYSITFGGFVGMSSYVSLLLTTQYLISRLAAGFLMALLSLTGAMVRPIGGLLADRLSGVRLLLALLITLSVCNFAFAAVMPSLPGAVCLLLVLYLCFGLGNGATFQLVPHRWKGKTGVMTGIIGAAGGIGGFYLPVIMSLAKEGTGSYQPGFATFGTLAALAFLIVGTLQRQWLAWAVRGETKVGLDPRTAT